MSSNPQSNKQWKVIGVGSFDNLQYDEAGSVPDIGDQDVLVKFEGASLNYRDLIIAKGKYPFGQRDKVVPGSDGAGTVQAIGSKVDRFKVGDKVVTLFNQGHLGGYIDQKSAATGVGDFLSPVEAATLTCAGTTAWNALYGISDRALKPGHFVLTQGTGGVSLFALQFAKAAGAKVIATTSSKEKEEKLKALGADFVINYKQDANWGETAKKLTGGNGVQHVIEVGGPTTTQQSLKAVSYEGVISVIGFIGGMKAEKPPTLLEALTSISTIRGVYVGSRLQMEDMIACIKANNIKPVVDDKIFKLEQVKEAYQYMWDQKHFGKVGIEIA